MSDAALAGGIGCLVVVATIAMVGMADPTPALGHPLAGGSFLVLAVAALVAALGGSWFIARRLREIRAMEERNRRLSAAVADAAEHERIRIGQDLHDDLGQHLTAIGMLSANLRNRLAEGSPELARDADRLAGLAEETGHRARALTRVCLIDWTERAGLAGSLRMLCGSASDLFGVRIEARIDERLDDADADIAPQIVRIVSEAINNAVRHTNSSTIMVSLELVGRGKGRGAANRAELRIEDEQGGTINTPATSHTSGTDRGAASGLGIAIMRARARAIGGELELLDGPGGGLVVRCVFPVHLNLASRRTHTHDRWIDAHPATPICIADRVIRVCSAANEPVAGSPSSYEQTRGAAVSRPKSEQGARA